MGAKPQALGERLRRGEAEELALGDLGLVVVSPLRRTLQTCTHVFGAAPPCTPFSAARETPSMLSACGRKPRSMNDSFGSDARRFASWSRTASRVGSARSERVANALRSRASRVARSAPSFFSIAALSGCAAEVGW